MSEQYMTSLEPTAFLVAAYIPLWGHPAQSVGGLLGSLTCVAGMDSLNLCRSTSSATPSRVLGLNSHAYGRCPVLLP